MILVSPLHMRDRKETGMVLQKDGIALMLDMLCRSVDTEAVVEGQECDQEAADCSSPGAAGGTQAWRTERTLLRLLVVSFFRLLGGGSDMVFSDVLRSLGFPQEKLGAQTWLSVMSKESI